ncbi:MAG: SpaA isopeptide-forming pilin-related protein [Coriobacteriia bacterium]
MKMIYRGGAFRRSLSALMAVVFTLSIVGSWLTVPTAASACGPGEFRIYKWVDANGNGKQDGGEAAKSGVTFTLTDKDDPSYRKSFKTGSDGWTTYIGPAQGNLRAGTYTVTEETDSSWTCTTGLPTITICADSAYAEYAVGNQQVPQPPKPGSICVTKYESWDGADHGDHGNKLGAGWTFILKDANGNVLDTKTTGANGSVTFSGLTPGNYKITEDLTGHSDYYLVTDLSGTFNVKSDKTTCVPVNNAKKKLGSLTVTKYEKRDGPDIKLGAGWTFILKDASGTVLDTKTTGDSGSVTFSNLTPGNYQVAEDLTGHSDYYLVTDLSGTYNVKADKTTDVKVYNAKKKLGSICVTKFESWDGADHGDHGNKLGAGWTFILKDASGNVLDTKTTGADGSVTFSGLTPGNYKITEDLTGHDSYYLVTDLSGTFNVQADKTTCVPVNNAKKKGSVKIQKYWDYNHNGSWNEGEPWLSGWTFSLKSGETVVAQGVTSGADGSVILSNIPAGDYQLVETLKDGWYNTTSLPIAVHIGQGDNGSVRVGNTYNVIKTFEFTYSHLPEGASLYVNYSVVGGSSGRVDLAQVGDSHVYRGTVTLPVMSTISGTWMLQLANGETFTLAEFGPELLSQDMVNQDRYYDPTAGGLKYNDLNGNGTQDEGEPGIAGWGFTLWRLTPGVEGAPAEWTVFATTLTDSDGDYSFSDMPPGTYRVTEENRTGWVNTEASTDQFSIVNGSEITGLDFGNYQSPTVTVLKYNDVNDNGRRDAGEPVLPGWTFTLTRGETVLTGTTGADGTVVFSGLTPGAYTLDELAQDEWIATTDLPIAIVLSGGDNLSLSVGNYLEPFEPFTDTSLTKKVNVSVAHPGDMVTYTLTYKNITEDPIDSVRITDDYDQRYMVPVNKAGATDSNGVLTWIDNTPLQPGESRTITYTMRVLTTTPDGTKVNNVAVITPGNHEARATVTINDPYLPYTGGEAGLIAIAALFAAAVGVTFRKLAKVRAS